MADAKQGTQTKKQTKKPTPVPSVRKGGCC